MLEQEETTEKTYTLSTQDALHGTIIQGYHFLIWYVVDIAFLFLLPRVYEYYVPGDNGTYEAGILLAMILLLVMILFFGGHTPGMIVANIRYAYEDTYKTLAFMDYLGYLFESWGERWKYNNMYESLSMWSNSHHQSPPMKTMGLIIVQKKKYKQFASTYSKHGIILRIDPKRDQQKKESAIFTDHED